MYNVTQLAIFPLCLPMTLLHGNVTPYGDCRCKHCLDIAVIYVLTTNV